MRERPGSGRRPGSPTRARYHGETRMKEQGKKKASSPPATRTALRVPSPEEVARRAYEIYLARGGEPGHEQEDWLRAEKELKERAASRK